MTLLLLLPPPSLSDPKIDSLRNLRFLTESGYFIVGDDAYALKQLMMVPVAGKNLEDHKDNFNFFLSQLRINIECAFGMLVN